MKVNLSDVLLDLKNAPIMEAGVPFTVGAACVQALLATVPEPTPPSAVEKLRRYKLAMKLVDQTSSDLDAEEVNLVKGTIGRYYNVLIVGRFNEIFTIKN